MLLYAFTLYSTTSTEGNPVLAVLLAPLAFVIAMYLYYGISKLAFLRYTWGLWVISLAAVVVTYLLVGSGQLWMTLTAWGMVLVTSMLTGRMTVAAWRPRAVYIAAVGSVVVFGIAQYLPFWQEVIRNAPENTAMIVEEARQQLSTIGESEERTRQIVESFGKLMSVVFRLAPATMLLASVVQYSVGYLLFVLWIDRKALSRPQLEPFRFWKMPYAFIPVVAMAAVVRLLGGGMLQIVADNALFFLGVYYMLAGLALLEYFLLKIQFTKFMKVLFYVFLFFLPLALPMMGLVVGALIALAGFVDSFADWRRVRLREFG